MCSALTNQEEEENYDSLDWSKSRGAGKAKNSTAKKNTAGQQLKHMSFISIKVLTLLQFSKCW